jgi:uncharacterized LabA/DUF88 family protein
MSAQELHIALLIDADNSPAAKIDVVLAELAQYGVANIRRAYGNWKKPGLKSWEDVLHEYAIQPVQQFDYSKGKNATDLAMLIDAMDLLYTQRLDGFAIMSSDSDFTPLAMRIKAQGVRVYGFGEDKTPKPFVNACSTFLYVERLGASALVADAPAANAPRKLPAELRQDTRLVRALRNAVESAAGDDGWAGLGAVGQQISNQGIDSRNYGYAKLVGLVEASELFEVRRANQAVWVRDRRGSKAAKSALTPEISSPAPEK